MSVTARLAPDSTATSLLVSPFIKYISDNYGNSDDFAPPVTIPKGASFKDMIALKAKSDIGDKINTQIIQPLASSVHDSPSRRIRNVQGNTLANSPVKN